MKNKIIMFDLDGCYERLATTCAMDKNEFGAKVKTNQQYSYHIFCRQCAVGFVQLY